MTSFKHRVQLVMLVLLVIIEGLTFAAVLATTRNTLIDQSREQLLVATQVFDNAIADRRKELETSVRVLAADFGFKRAVATSDRPTLLSALHNHGARINADLTMYINRAGELVASTDQNVTRDILPLDTLRSLATDSGAGDGVDSGHVVILNESALLVVVAPVRAPEVIGWVAIGFAIDDALAMRIQALTNVQVAFVQTSPVRMLIAATFSKDDSLALEDTANRDFEAETVNIGSLATDDFLGVAHNFSITDQASIAVVLATPMDSILQAFSVVRLRLVLILLLALVLSWLGASVLANTIARPLRELSVAARKISDGDYNQDVSVHGGSEVEQLSTAFNTMQEGIKDRQAKILYQAHHDALTDLPNRTLMNDRLEHAIARARRHDRSFAVILLDLDGFKSINDSLGHTIGDQVLIGVAAKLKQIARDSDTVARFGGDEFVLLLEESDADDARAVAQRISKVLAVPIEIDDVQVLTNISAGIVTYPEHGDTGETLLRRADIALYSAKDRDKQQVMLYETGRDEEHLGRIRLMSELRIALETNGLTVQYQPKVDLRTNRVCSVEALVRWTHPELGIQPPDVFIPLAEQSGIIQDLTAYVLNAVFRQLQNWRNDGLAIDASINLSAHDLLNAELPNMIRQLLLDHDLPASSIILEVTESAVMKDAAYARGVMQQLRSQGIRLSIDDFGTGHASLSQLKSLPVDELKIDKSFVLDLLNNDDDKVIVRSTIDLAHNMGLTVTAEGVEDAASRQLLESYRCDVIQGYFISKPLVESDLRAWLLQRNGRENQPTEANDLADDDNIIYTGDTSVLASG